MAGNPVRPASIGVGPALRRAREIRGLALEAAARDTKLPVERLRALEDEDFEDLPGEVFTRASLRTYSQYLGLVPDKVLAAYARYAEDPAPPPPPAKAGRVEQALAAARIRDSQKFFLIAAAVVLAALVAVGLVSREGAPDAARLPSDGPSLSRLPIDAALFTLVLETTRPVTVTVEADGEREEVAADEGETLSFSAAERLDVEVSDGGAVRATIAGLALGAPAGNGVPWSVTYTADSVRAMTASAAASASEAASADGGDEDTQTP